MLRKDLPIRTDLTDSIVGSSGSTITVYANPIVSKVRTNLLSESGGITIPEPVLDVPWNPSYTSTAIWLKSSVTDSVVLDGSNNVTQWLDLSGNNRHFIQVDSSKRPARIVSGLNSKNTIRFDGVDDTLNSSPVTFGSTDYDFFIVFKTSSTNTKGIWGGRNTVVDPASRIGLFLTGSNALRTMNHHGGNDYSPYPVNTFNIVGSYRQLGAISLLLDAVPVLTASITGGYLSNIPLSIGSWDNNLVPSLPGDITELVVTSANLSNNDRDKMFGYLAHEWVNNLPSGHPYKTSPPTLFT